MSSFVQKKSVVVAEEPNPESATDEAGKGKATEASAAAVEEEGTTEKNGDKSSVSPDAQSAEAGGVSGQDAAETGKAARPLCVIA